MATDSARVHRVALDLWRLGEPRQQAPRSAGRFAFKLYDVGTPTDESAAGLRVEPFGLEAVPDLPRLDALSDHSINWEGPWRSIRTRRAYCLPWPEAPC